VFGLGKCRVQGRPGLWGLAVVTLVLSTACGVVPGTGPSAVQVSAGGDVLSSYVVVDLSTEVAAALADYKPESFAARFAAPRPVPTQRVGVGDTLAILLLEAGQGGLFSSAYGARVALTNIVASDGTISVPYAGQIKASGLTTAQVEKEIVAALEGKAIQPQALVGITTNASRTYVIDGQVGASGRYPITTVGDRVLDAIATAGGAKAEPHQIRVRLTRGGQSGSVMLNRLVANPAENVYVQPEDKLYLTLDPEVFTAMGEVQSTQPIPFVREKLNLIEGVALAGGLVDQTADRTGIFVFRYEADSVVRRIKPSYDGRFGATVPVVYRVNFGNPNAYFFAKSFMLRDKDVIYVAEAPGTELLKFVQILNGSAGAYRTVQGLSKH
jgi:polysaccharide export outer membrane protein